jgi:tRNA dimethylallyltransferase
MLPPVIVLGATASGKSDVAMEVAQLSTTPVHIVAADAMQVYRRMDIGTAKPTRVDQSAVPHHCIDIVEPSERYTVAAYLQHAQRAFIDIDNVGARALVVGGTGLYVSAIVDGLSMPGEWPEIRTELEAIDDTSALYSELQQRDPQAATKMEPNNRRRIIRALEVCRGSGTTFSSFGPGLDQYPATDIAMIGIRWSREALSARIERRVQAMVQQGLVAEVRSLVTEQPGLSPTAAQALGYKEMIAHIEGNLTLQEAVDLVVLRTRQFAVRQDRWYRRDPRITWIDIEDGAESAVEAVVPVVIAAIS